MASYVEVHIVCDRCRNLIGIVLQELAYNIQKLEKNDYPEGTVLSKDGNEVYCERCPEKYAKQLGFSKEED